MGYHNFYHRFVCLHQYAEYFHQVLVIVLSITPGIQSVPVFNMTRSDIILVTTITYGNVKVSVGTKSYCAAIVIKLRMRFFKNNFF